MSETAAVTNPVIKDSETGILYEFRLENGRFKLSPVDSESSESDIEVAANWPAVTRLSDGQNVDAATLNKPIEELAERTNYLYDKIRVFDRYNPLAAVVVSDVKLDPSDTPALGDVVYMDPDRLCRKALATSDLLDMFTASGSSFAVGVLSARSGLSGSITMFGRVGLAASSYDLAKMVEDGETYRDGVYYLSGRQAGRITATPSGPRVLVGQFYRSTAASSSGKIPGDFALVHVEARDFAEAHVHRSYGLVGLPAGEQACTEDAPGGRHVFLGYSTDPLANESRGSDYDAVVAPRLVFTGEWLLHDSHKYEFVLCGSEGRDAAIGVTDDDGNLVLRFGENPGVYLYWKNEDTDAEGLIQFTAFKQPKALENGVYVELRPDPSLEDGSTLVYSCPPDSEDIDVRKWSQGMTLPDAGRGWRDLTADEIARFENDGRRVPKFVYNCGFDASLQAFYPPVPLQSAALMMNGVELASNRFGDTYAYSLEPDSVYWYDDGWDNAPWPVNYTTRGSTVGDWEERRLVLHFTKATTTETGPVTSLAARKGSGLRIYRCGSDEESGVGDLEIDFDPTGNVDDANLEGYKVVKAGKDGRLLTGPVVERIVAGSGIMVTRWGSSPQGQGTVVISAKSGGLQGPFEEVALQNAKQDLVGMFPYVRLLGWSSSESASNTASAFILKFHVPYDNAAGVYRVHLSGSVFGLTSYTGGDARYAGLQLRYSILPDLNPVGDGTTAAAANVQDDLVGNDGVRPLEIPLVSRTGTAGAEYTAFDPVFVHTDDGSADVVGSSYAAFGDPLPLLSECKSYADAHPSVVEAQFGVQPGHTVAVRIARGPVLSGVSEYTGSIGFMNLRWFLERVS